MAVKSYTEAATAETPPPQLSPGRKGVWAAILARYPAFGSPLYIRYWRASAASIGATQLTVLAQGWLLFELTGSPLHLGVLGASASIPYLIVSLFGGVIADRFDKKSIVLATTAMNAFLLLALAMLVFANWIAAWHIWLVAGITALVNGVEWPTRQALFVHLIDRDALPSAVALNSFLWQSTRMLAPAVGGVLLSQFDASVVFLFATVGYLWMLLALFRMPLSLPGHSSESTWAQLSGGIKYIASTPLFSGLITLTFASMFFGISFMQLMPAFAKHLNMGETGFGLLMSSTGLGSIVGTLASGSIRVRKSLGLFILGTVLCTAFSLLVFALNLHFQSQVGAYLAVCTIAVFNSVFMLNVMTLLQRKVPDHLRGRVMGIYTACYSFLTLGGLFLGWIASERSETFALTIGASIVIAFTLSIGASFRSVRTLSNEV